MATVSSPFDPAAIPSGTLLRVVIVAGVAASLGAICAFLGVTEVVALLYGYRPDGPLALAYAWPFALSVSGWSLLAWALLLVLRTGRRIR